MDRSSIHDRRRNRRRDPTVVACPPDLGCRADLGRVVRRRRRVARTAPVGFHAASRRRAERRRAGCRERVVNIGIDGDGRDRDRSFRDVYVALFAGRARVRGKHRVRTRTAIPVTRSVVTLGRPVAGQRRGGRPRYRIGSAVARERRCRRGDRRADCRRADRRGARAIARRARSPVDRARTRRCRRRRPPHIPRSRVAAPGGHRVDRPRAARGARPKARRRRDPGGRPRIAPVHVPRAGHVPAAGRSWPGERRGRSAQGFTGATRRRRARRRRAPNHGRLTPTTSRFHHRAERRRRRARPPVPARLAAVEPRTSPSRADHRRA